MKGSWMQIFGSFSQFLSCLGLWCSILRHNGSAELRPLSPQSSKTVPFCSSYIPYITIRKMSSEKSHSVNIDLTICASFLSETESCLFCLFCFVFFACAFKQLIYVCHPAFIVVLAEGFVQYQLLYHAWLRLEIP